MFDRFRLGNDPELGDSSPLTGQYCCKCCPVNDNNSNKCTDCDSHKNKKRKSCCFSQKWQISNNVQNIIILVCAILAFIGYIYFWHIDHPFNIKHLFSDLFRSKCDYSNNINIEIIKSDIQSILQHFNISKNTN